MKYGLTLPILVVASCCYGDVAHAQTLYGSESATLTLWEFPNIAGAPCGQPVPVILPCPFAAPACPLIPAPLPTPPPPLGIFGDVAARSTTPVGPFPGTDTVFVTSGAIIQEYVADGPCGLPPACTPINAIPIPAFLGPITGMEMEETGALTGGVPVLLVTDGVFIAGLGVPPPFTCGPVPVFGPCPVPLPTPGALLTDLTWDPLTGTVWACDTAGFVHNIALAFAPPACGILFTFPAAACGLVPPLQGIAFDLASGRALSPAPAPALFVTDGFMVQYVTVAGGFPFPTFYAPLPCSPTPAPLNGLAYASHDVEYGFPAGGVTCDTFGSSVAGSANFGLQYTGAPPAAIGVLLVNFRPPGPGFACPPVLGSGGTFWVDPAGGAPAFFFFTPPPGGGCVPIPIAIPPGVATGSQVFFEFLFATAPAIVANTQGCAFTITAP